MDCACTYMKFANELEQDYIRCFMPFVWKSRILMALYEDSIVIQHIFFLWIAWWKKLRKSICIFMGILYLNAISIFNVDYIISYYNFKGRLWAIHYHNITQTKRTVLMHTVKGQQ